MLARRRYATDGWVNVEGPFLDDLALTVDGVQTFADDVESGDNGWLANGFTRMGGSTSVVVPQFYLAENRVYAGYDATLKTGPYNFGWADTSPDWVERFPYQHGMRDRYSACAGTATTPLNPARGGHAVPRPGEPGRGHPQGGGDWRAGEQQGRAEHDKAGVLNHVSPEEGVIEDAGRALEDHPEQGNSRVKGHRLATRPRRVRVSWGNGARTPGVDHRRQAQEGIEGWIERPGAEETQPVPHGRNASSARHWEGQRSSRDAVTVE